MPVDNIVSNSHVLVTGGAGFIGSNLVKALLDAGNSVTCLDNFSTGRRDNIAPFLTNPAFTLIEDDIRELDACRRAARDARFIFHEAALGSVPRSIDDPGTSVDVNVTGTVNILDAAVRNHTARVLFASSSSVYGDDDSNPKSEDVIGHQLSPYAVSKYADELFAANFARVYGLSTIGLRYFNVFGPRQTPFSPYAAVIPLFAQAFISHQSPLIHGDGTVSRDFTYVTNVVRANLLAAVAPESAAGTIYNIACGGSTSILELFNGLRACLAKYDPDIAGIQPLFDAPRKGDIQFSNANITRAQTCLGYVPVADFQSGLPLAADWYWNNLRNTPQK